MKARRIDALLSEYQACHLNRDHYDSLIWTIGTIFMALSLTLFGASFLDEVVNNNGELFVMLVSIASVAFWYLSMRCLNPYVMASIKRLHQIELELSKMGVDIRLHYSVWKAKEGERIGISGSFLAVVLWGVILVGWMLRIYMFPKLRTNPNGGIITLILALGVVAVTIIHLLGRRRWGNDIEQIIKERDKYKLFTYHDKVSKAIMLDRRAENRRLDQLFWTTWGIAVAFAVQVLYDIFGLDPFNKILPKWNWGLMIVCAFFILVVAFKWNWLTRKKQD